MNLVLTVVQHNMVFLRHFLGSTVRLPSYQRFFHSGKQIYQKASDPNHLAILLQKNLAQRNSSLYNPELETIRCTIFNSKGIIQKPSIDLRRDELIHTHGLLPRDLRKIEKSRRNDLVPSVLVRENSILISILNIRALVKSDMLILFDSLGIKLDSVSQQNFITDLQLRLQNKSGFDVPELMNKDPLPYEFRAIESIFVSAISNLSAELKVHLNVTNGILQDLEYSITRDKLRYLLIQNKKLSVFYKKSFLMREMIDELLDQDDVLCEMYLTEKKLGKPREEHDHAEIEMLLETYYNHVDEIVQTVGNTMSNVKTTEEIINIILDSNRNQLMLLGLRFSIGLLSLAGSIFIASVYGMNLENFIEEGNFGFPLVSTIGVVLMAYLFIFSIKHLHKLEKVQLMSHGKGSTLK